MPDASSETVAGRRYSHVYHLSGRKAAHAYVIDGLGRAGGKVTASSPHTRGPFHFAVQVGERQVGLVVYAFSASPPPIGGRPADEHRTQIRYGSEESWAEEWPLWQDPAGLDVTLVLAAHDQAGIFVALDPLLYDPLPMGISVEFKDADVKQVRERGWHVWERETRAGSRRAEPRAPATYETLVGFTPERLLDFVEFERSARALRLDPALRFSAAVAAEGRYPSPSAQRHELERLLGLEAGEVYELIADRRRLKTALFGGAAEVHLQRHLEKDRDVRAVRQIDEDGQPDFDVELRDGRHVLVECKNASPNRTREGSFKIDLQKTRHSKDDRASRYYEPSQFDVVAVCLFSPTGEWRFLFRSTRDLPRHDEHPDRLRPSQPVDPQSWHEQIADAAAG